MAGRDAVEVPVQTVSVRLVATGDWCARCALPSLVTREELIHIGDPPQHDSRMSYLLIDSCDDCQVDHIRRPKGRP